MRIGIDARFYGPIGKGLGRYTQEVVDNIIEINNEEKSSDFTYVVFLSKDNYDLLKNDKNNNVEKVMVNCHWYTLKEQILMPYYFYKANLDLLHIPHFNVPVLYFKKFVVTIHDLILTHFPTIKATTKSKLVYRFKNFAYKFIIRHALKNSSKIITVSKFTKDDIVKEFNIVPEKIIVTYEGVSFLNNDRDKDYLINESGNLKEIPNNFIFYVGSAYPHKNLERLLDVFDKYGDHLNGLKLILVGRIDYFYQRLIDAAIEKGLYKKNDYDNSKVIFLGHVSDMNLKSLYQRAKAFIFPSLYEGFGLPPLEAISNNCLVLCSDKASLPEVVGDGAIYFNPENIIDIYNAILKIDDSELKKNVLEKGKEFIQKYSWKECSIKTRDVYLSVLNNR